MAGNLRFKNDADLNFFLRGKKLREAAASQPVAAAPAKRSKYGNVKTERDGISFDSKREADRYAQLMLRYKAGEISKPALQVAFPLTGGIRYVCDFLYVMKTDGRLDLVVEDSKGHKTDAYKLKRKLMLADWGIAIVET